MSLSVPALTSAVTALRYQLRRMDQAAQVISAAGLKDMPDLDQEQDSWYTEPRPKEQDSVGGEFTEAMVTMLKAQRDAIAQLRTLEAKQEMTREILETISDPEGDGPGH